MGKGNSLGNSSNFVAMSGVDSFSSEQENQLVGLTV